MPQARAETPGVINERSLEELTNTGLATAPRNIVVTTSSKYAQISSHALTSLRIQTAEDIRIYGWRTLAEALRSLPGIYISNDRKYATLGMRGFGRSGDYNSRALLIIDGERVNERLCLRYRESPREEARALISRVNGPCSRLVGSVIGKVPARTERPTRVWASNRTVSML